MKKRARRQLKRFRWCLLLAFQYEIVEPTILLGGEFRRSLAAHRRVAYLQVVTFQFDNSVGLGTLTRGTFGYLHGDRARMLLRGQLVLEDEFTLLALERNRVFRDYHGASLKVILVYLF